MKNSLSEIIIEKMYDEVVNRFNQNKGQNFDTENQILDVYA